MKSSGIIYYHEWNYREVRSEKRKVRRKNVASSVIGLGMLALAFGGLTGPMIPRIRLEAQYALLNAPKLSFFVKPGFLEQNLQKKPGFIEPAVFNPLKQPDGSEITPINTDFSLIIPKIGINASVIPAVNPTKPGEYLSALQKGIAHSSLSYFPDEDGTVYLFSHSTNYDWFVRDMNAVFYLLKNLEENDMVVLYYKGSPYTYKITGKQVVKPTAVNYLAPQAGQKRLILQTCWPPGSTTERLLIFADLVQETNQKI